MDEKEKKEIKNEDEEKELNEQAEKLAKLTKEKLGLEKLEQLGEKVDSLMEKKADKDKRLAKILVQGVEKGIDDMTKEEKICSFFTAVVRNDTRVLKALSEGTAADGGYLFLDEFRAEIIKDIEEKNRMRSLIRVVPMTRDIMKIPTVESKPKVSWTAENATKDTTTVHFNEATLTVYKMAAILYASDELVEDSQEIDVIKLVISLFAEAIADEEDRIITAGSGTGQPTGLTNCSIGAVVCSGNLDFDDLIRLIYTLPSKYRIKASLLVHNTNISELRRLKDSNNRYYWQEPLSAGQPATFHGYPVYENNHLPEAEIYFGDWKETYWLGDRRKMTVKTSQEAGNAWERDQTSIRVVERIAGNCVNIRAARRLTTIP